MAVIEGLDAERIAGEEERALAVVPNGKSKHTAQARQAALAPVCIGREQNFCIAVCPKGPSGGGEFVAEPAEVVDRAVENERETAVG